MMETVISLLVLGAIYLVSYVMKSLSASSGEEGGKSIFGEGFPTIEVLEPEHEQEPEPKPVFESKPEPKPEPKVEIPRPLAVPKVYTMPKPQVKPAPAVERVATAVPQTSVQVHSFETEEPVKHKRLVALNSKSAAKRAFIYSEIFNRKY